MNSSEFFGFLAGRSSVRSYTGQELTPEEVEYIMDCASTAPSAGNMQAWDVVLVTAREQTELISAARPGLPHVGPPPHFSGYANKSVPCPLGGAGPVRAPGCHHRCTYMILAAHAAGLVTCWVGAFDEEEVRKLLRLPVHARPVAILCVGKGIIPSVRTGRMPLAEHIHEDRW